MRDDIRFSYSTAPHAVHASKSSKKYRDDSKIIFSTTTGHDRSMIEPSSSSSVISMNLMNDPRVMRGRTNTATLKTTTTGSKMTSKTNTGKRTAKSYESSMHTTDRPYYEFRYHYSDGESFDLNPYLVEQLSTKQNHDNESSQTDEFVPQPQTPKYIPRKTGIDVSTQVEDTMELFDFNAEVAPIVHVLVSKTIEQALFEVKSEEELIVLERIQQSYHENEKHHIEWMKVEEEKARQEIEEKIVIVEKKQKKLQELLHLRQLVAGHEFIEQIIPDIIQNIFDNLYEEKIWKHEEEEICRNEIIPNLCGQVEILCAKRDEAKALVDELFLVACEEYENRPMATYEPLKTVKLIVSVDLEQIEPVGMEEEQPYNEESVSLGPWILDESTTITSLFRKIQKSLRDKSLKPAQPLTEAVVSKYFTSIVGTQIASDASLMNFALSSELRFAI